MRRKRLNIGLVGGEKGGREGGHYPIWQAAAAV